MRWGTTLGKCGIGVNNQDTDVKDDCSWNFYDGMDGCLREVFNRGEEGSGRVNAAYLILS